MGVIHRDLKPQNIMWETDSGRILVMDFGLAKTLEGDRMTQTGAMVGTMEYMSPEQALAGNLDQRSDIFSLGLIFYELLTGQTPFRADSALASLIKRTQERVVPVSEFDKSVPPELSQIVSRCLERDVTLRYQSARGTAGRPGALVGHRQVRHHRRPPQARSPQVGGRATSGCLPARLVLVLLLVAVIGLLPYPAQDRGCSRGQTGGASRPAEIAGDFALSQFLR